MTHDAHDMTSHNNNTTGNHMTHNTNNDNARRDMLMSFASMMCDNDDDMTKCANAIDDGIAARNDIDAFMSRDATNARHARDNNNNNDNGGR